MTNELSTLADSVAQRLAARKETLVIAESSAGGLISAALLAVPGASAFFLGGLVVYTRAARESLLAITPETLDRAKIRPATEAYALLLARRTRDKLGADWALSETGATGPTGNRYGDPAGHACFAVVGAREAAVTLRTDSVDRRANMTAFARGALALLDKTLLSG